MEVRLKKYDHNEYKQLEEYYKKQCTEDYASVSSRIERTKLHADLITISENLWDSRERCYKRGKESVTEFLDRLATCLWKGDDYLDEVAGIFEEYDFGNMEYPSIDEDSKENKIFNTMLNQSCFVFDGFCFHYHFQERLSALTIMLQENKGILTSSDDYFFPGEDDEIFFHLKNRYQEYFEVCARLYPLSHLVEIINRKGYEYKINIDEDFKDMPARPENYAGELTQDCIDKIRKLRENNPSMAINEFFEMAYKKFPCCQYCIKNGEETNISWSTLRNRFAESHIDIYSGRGLNHAQPGTKTDNWDT